MPAVVGPDPGTPSPDHIRFEPPTNVTPNEKPHPDHNTSSSSIAQELALGHIPPDRTRRADVATAILRRTVWYIVGGVAIMLLGIGIAHAAILPKIHSCPTNGVCSTFFDPNKSNILNLLQTLMDYWLKLGLIIAGFGLIKLSAYQAWFSTMKNGNTIDNLDLTLGAIKGGLLDAFRIAVNQATFFLGLLILAQIGLGSIVSLLVGVSIDRTSGVREITFSYPDVTELPNSRITFLNNDGQVRAIGKVVSWAITNDTTHSGAFRGTLVTPDGRTNSSINAIPGGPQIDGRISCAGVPSENVTSISNDGSPAYNINLPGPATYMALPTLPLAVTQIKGIDTAFTPYLWVANKTGLLPNATSIDGGKLFATICNHTLFMTNTTDWSESPAPESQIIHPNVISSVPGCSVTDQGLCIGDSVSSAILSWWGGLGQSFWKMTCRGGVMGPVKPIDGVDGPCALNQDIWTATARAMLDGIMQTTLSRSTSTQTLLATVEVVNTKRWWLIQIIVPILTAALYAVTLAYTVYLSEGSTMLKELDLAEIIDAAQTDHVRDLVRAGRLRKSVVRYGSNVGFLEDPTPRRQRSSGQ